jgi:hypothetical protein
MKTHLRKILVALGLAVLLVGGHRAWGWGGVALVSGGILMWLLLHFNRFMTVMRRASERPFGYVDSAVMLNVKLRPRVSLLHVIALTRALGELRSPEGQQPEVYRWTDPGGSWVDAEFDQGRLVRWTMWRPQAEDGAAGGSQADSAAAS